MAPKEKKVRITLATLRARYNLAFDEVVFYRDPTGELGKANGALAKRVNVLVDDRDDICKEALAKGIKVYPIMKKGQTHSWAKQAFASFAAAAGPSLRKGCKAQKGLPSLDKRLSDLDKRYQPARALAKRALQALINGFDRLQTLRKGFVQICF